MVSYGDGLPDPDFHRRPRRRTSTNRRGSSSMPRQARRSRVGRARTCRVAHPRRGLCRSDARSVRSEDRHNGRHPLPDPHALAQTFGRLGIESGMQVVAYDQENGMFASRLWWLLRWLGHDAVAVLEAGSRNGRRKGGRSRAAASRAPRARSADRPRAEMTVDVNTSRRISAPCRRASSTHARRSAIAATPSRSTRSAATSPARRTISSSGTWTNRDCSARPSSCATTIKASVGDVPADRIVCYCGSGVTACHNLLAFEHAGLTGAKLYAGSWSEWSADQRGRSRLGNWVIG